MLLHAKCLPQPQVELTPHIEPDGKAHTVAVVHRIESAGVSHLAFVTYDPFNHSCNHRPISPYVAGNGHMHDSALCALQDEPSFLLFRTTFCSGR